MHCPDAPGRRFDGPPNRDAGQWRRRFFQIANRQSRHCWSIRSCVCRRPKRARPRRSIVREQFVDSAKRHRSKSERSPKSRGHPKSECKESDQDDRNDLPAKRRAFGTKWSPKFSFDEFIIIEVVVFIVVVGHLAGRGGVYSPDQDLVSRR